MELLLDKVFSEKSFCLLRRIGALDTVHYFLLEVKDIGKMCTVQFDFVKAFGRASWEMMLELCK